MVYRIVSIPAEQVPVLLFATIKLAVVPCLRAWLVLLLWEAWTLAALHLRLIWGLAFSKFFKRSLVENSTLMWKVSAFWIFHFFFKRSLVEDSIYNAGLLMVFKLNSSLVGLRALVSVIGRIISPSFEAEGSASLIYLGAFRGLELIVSKALLGRFCHLVQFGIWLLNCLLSRS